MVRKFGGPGAAFLISKLQNIRRQIEQDKAGLAPVLMNSQNVIVPSKQLKQDHAIIIRMNREDAKRMRLVQSIYGHMYKDLDEILKQEKVLPSKLLENASHLVVYASVLEAIVTSAAVGEFAWSDGWSKVGVAIKEKIFGDEKEIARVKVKNAIANLDKQIVRLEGQINYKVKEEAAKSWWRRFF
ncbi:hypothetical protein LguiA_027958 [Lonicera macranthoides]